MSNKPTAHRKAVRAERKKKAAKRAVKRSQAAKQKALHEERKKKKAKRLKEQRKDYEAKRTVKKNNWPDKAESGLTKSMVLSAGDGILPESKKNTLSKSQAKEKEALKINTLAAARGITAAQ